MKNQYNKYENKVLIHLRDCHLNNIFRENIPEQI